MHRPYTKYVVKLHRPPLRNFQVLKGDSRNPKSMKPLGEPCMNASEARGLIRNDSAALPPETFTMYAVHVISSNVILTGSVVVARRSTQKAA